VRDATSFAGQLSRARASAPHLRHNCHMSKVRVAAFSISIDGFGAGPRQDLQNPLGVRGSELHGWFRPTELFKKMQGESGGTTGIDNEIAAQSFEKSAPGY
jgi:hypothetical protein